MVQSSRFKVQGFCTSNFVLSINQTKNQVQEQVQVQIQKQKQKQKLFIAHAQADCFGPFSYWLPSTTKVWGPSQ
jgi:hypothetical protein